MSAEPQPKAGTESSLGRRTLIVVASVVVFAAAAVAFVVLRSPTYASTAQVQLTAATTDRGGSTPSGTVLLPDPVQQIASTAVRDRADGLLGGSGRGIGSTPVTATYDPGTGSLTIVARAASPKLARATAAAYSTAYVGQTEAEVTARSDQLGTEITTLAAKITALQAEPGSDTDTLIQAEITAATQSYSSLQADQYAIDVGRPYATVDVAADLPTSPVGPGAVVVIALGVLVGLVLGMAVVVGRGRSADRRPAHPVGAVTSGASQDAVRPATQGSGVGRVADTGPPGPAPAPVPYPASAPSVPAGSGVSSATAAAVPPERADPSRRPGPGVAPRPTVAAQSTAPAGSTVPVRPRVPARSTVPAGPRGSMGSVKPGATPHAPQIAALRAQLDARLERGGHRVVVVTSPRPGADKSRVAADLATSWAQLGTSVILVSADFRWPRLEELLGVPGAGRPGLSDLIRRRRDGLRRPSGRREARDRGDPTSGGPVGGGTPPVEASAVNGLLLATGVVGLRVLPAGTRLDDPSDLLSSRGMQAVLDRLVHLADIVVVETPPTSSVRDAAVIGQLSDGPLVLVSEGDDGDGTADRALHRLDDPSSDIVRIVLDPVDREAAERG